MKYDLDSDTVKDQAKRFGADLVGIVSAKTLNEFPPDPKWPQTPERISPHAKSVIVIAKRIPIGAFRAKTNIPVQHVDMLVLRARRRNGRKMTKNGWRHTVSR